MTLRLQLASLRNAKMSLPPPPKPTYPGTLPPPPGVTANINFVPNEWNLITHVLCIVVPTVFTLARFWTKAVVMRRWDADDYAALVAWLCLILYEGLSIPLGPLGLGNHIWNIAPSTFQQLFMYGYIVEVFYGPTAFAVKVAILMLLTRIFSIKRAFVRSIHMLIAVLAVYYIVITFIKIFMCNPIAKFWKPRLPGKCLNTNLLFIADCIIAIITDLVVLCVPLPIIWRLKMNTMSKIGSSIALIAGGFACIASILRLEVTLKSVHDHDKPHAFFPILLWSSCEVAVGLICCHLPILPSLFRHYFQSPKQVSHVSQTYGSGTERWRSSNRGQVPLQVIPSTDSIPRGSSVSSSEQRIIGRTRE